MKNLSYILLTWTLMLARPGTIVAQADGEIPQLSRPVTDFTGTLSPVYQERLENRLRAHEDTTSIQIAVVLVPSLGGRSAEDVSMAIFEKNRIGQARKDNGVLLLVALAERTVRIEVGYGLEEVLTDARCAIIIDREIKPYFRQRKFYEGLNAGITGIIQSTQGTFTTDHDRKSRAQGIPFLVLMLLILYVSYRRMRRSTLRIGSLGGGWSPRTGWGVRGTWTGGGTSIGGGWSGGGGLGGGGGATGRW